MRDLILERMNEARDLPPLPEIVIKLQNLLNDPRSNVRSIAALIELEPALAGRVMKIANSVYYTRGGQAKTLPIAIGKLGLNELLKIVYSLEVSQLFRDGTLIDSGQFWRHSLAVAVFAQLMARELKMSKEEQDLAYLAGLLHDVGVMVFAFVAPDEYRSFLKKLIEKEEPLHVQEKETFGVDHAELGAEFIGAKWQIDERIVEAVKYHHEPYPPEKAAECCYKLIHVANGIVVNQGVSNGIFAYQSPFKESAWVDLGLSLENAQKMLEDVERSLEQATALMRL